MKKIKTKKKYLYDLGNFNSPLLDKPPPWAGPRVKYCLRCSFWLLAVYSRAENKEASLPAGTIPLAYVRRYSVQKWTVGRVGGVTRVVQVIKCAQKRATDRLSATLQSILQHAIWLACAKREKTTVIPWEKACAIVKLQLSRCTLVRRIVKDADCSLRIDELIMVWNFRRFLLLYIFELIIEEPV